MKNIPEQVIPNIGQNFIFFWSCWLWTSIKHRFNSMDNKIRASMLLLLLIFGGTKCNASLFGPGTSYPFSSNVLFSNDIFLTFFFMHSNHFILHIIIIIIIISIHQFHLDPNLALHTTHTHTDRHQICILILFNTFNVQHTSYHHHHHHYHKSIPGIGGKLWAQKLAK